MIDQVYQQIENSALTTMEIDKCLNWVCHLAQSQLNLSLSKEVLHRRLLQSNADKDILFDQRLSQLKDLMSEIRRFEKLIKDNANLVDNMILPQLKAMSATY